MKFIEYFMVFVLFVGGVVSETKQTNPTYKAAVVEFNLKPNVTGQQKIDENTARVIEIINSDTIRNVDILVFPESILNDDTMPIPLVDSFIDASPCDSPDIHKILHDISCAVKQASKYVVIDLVIKDETDDLYNMALAFNRTGAIIAKYRKFNPYGEPNIRKPTKPDVITFKTDFNVTFGIFICFDLLFEEPITSLLNNGIRNFIFPTMWYSELPFLTAVQIQQSWAYANNANLLAANGNLPIAGSSGSGIYAGRYGALVTHITEKPETKILIADVPINRRIDNPAEIDSDEIYEVPTSIQRSQSPESELNVWKEDLSNYEIKFLPIEVVATLEGSLCKNEICCNFKASVHDNGPIANKATYYYAMAVLDGYRSYISEPQIKTYQKVCSIIACTQQNDPKSCAKRFPPSTAVHQRYRFNELNITTEIPVSLVKIMPNSLAMDLVPVEKFFFNKTELEGTGTYHIEMNLMEPRSDLLTFGTYTRDFKRDIGKGAASINGTTVSMVICFTSTVFFVKLMQTVWNF